MVARVNPPPLRVPQALLRDPELSGFFNELLVIIRQLWAKAGANLILDDGSEGAPSLTFASDTGLGLYRPADDTLGITADGNDIAYFSPDGLQLFNLDPASFVYNDASGNLESYIATDGQLLIGFSGASPILGNIQGTPNRLTVTNTPGSISLNISISYVGQASITTVGTLITGTWNASTIQPDYGGTGLTNYTTGDLIYASGATNLSLLADVATGNALISGGVGAAPAWGKIGLTTHVSGNLPVTNLNSGTNADATHFWRGDGSWATILGSLPYSPASGTWTPTLTNIANLDSTTAFPCIYSRTDNTVNFSGKITIDATNIAVATKIGISLPPTHTSDFANDYDCCGTASSPSITNAGASIYADAANNRMTMEFVASDTSSNIWFFNGSYRVI